MLLPQLRTEIQAWSQYNFGTVPTWQPVLGLIEECGELAHSYLKMTQAIRIDEPHLANIKDAIADWVIYSIDFMWRSDLDPRLILPDDLDSLRNKSGRHRLHRNGQSLIMSLAGANGVISTYEAMGWPQPAPTPHPITTAYVILSELCDLFEWNLGEVVTETWLQVRQRDWRNFPNTKGLPPSVEAKGVAKLPDPNVEGLYMKYVLRKRDGSPVNPAAQYFVLRLDTDPAARAAAYTYAIAISDSNPFLADDINQWVKGLEEAARQ